MIRSRSFVLTALLITGIVLGAFVAGGAKAGDDLQASGTLDPNQVWKQFRSAYPYTLAEGEPACTTSHSEG